MVRALCSVLALVASLAAQACGKAVFAHFMVGNTNNYTQSDWERDISLAQEAHIDAFALNIANNVGGITAPLQLAFYVASQMGFKLFFSFDYAGNGDWDKNDIISLCGSYCNNPAYYYSHGGPLISTFEGPENAADWHEIKASTGCFFIPDWSSLGAMSALKKADNVADALFNWAAWPWGNLDMNTYTDASYWMYLEQFGGKPYIMPASPWFYTNLPGYNKNWLWRGDNIWYDRWVQIIYNQPDFVEIISWNDYGESHYIGPLQDKAMEAFSVGKAPFNYASSMPHDGWRAFLPYVIDLYKEGTASITREGVQGWWRRTAAGACGDGGTTGNTASQLQVEFDPATIMADKVFFSALLGSHADVSVTVGGTSLNARWTWTPDDGVGIYHGSADFGSATGEVVISVIRSGKTIATLSPGSNGSIGPQSCVNGLQNWNAYVGSAWGGSILATPTLKVSEQKCINGTGYGNFEGLCEFSCKYGYCDHSSCVCQAMGSPSATPSGVAPTGYPAAGLDASYSGVCAFDCAYGFCPPSACSLEESPLTTPTVSDFSPPACVAGTALAGPDSNLGGLCGYACNFGFCPYHACSCTAQGALVVPPDIVEGTSGEPAAGVDDYGLCAFACQRGYCPSPTCVDTSPPDPGNGGIFGEDPGWSATGQYCFKSPCSKRPTWNEGQGLAATFFPDDCDAGEYRIVVCPAEATPDSCTWRGTGPLCNPSCQPGEVAIETSVHGSEECTVGEQGLCCKSETWRNLIASCSWSIYDTCPMVGQVNVAKRSRSRCLVQGSGGCLQYTQYDEIFCCDANFPNCKWASCANNICTNQQIEVASDPYGAGGTGCSVASTASGDLPSGNSQALCCDNPERANPFLPVELDWLFPTLPPAGDITEFRMDHIKSKLLPDLPLGQLQPFGFVVIDGPADLVTSLSKRDGSHIEFLDCEPGIKHDMTLHTARYVCTNNSTSSNCDDVHLGGAEGTVIKLPDECGYATYGVVHGIKESSDQGMPLSIRGITPDNAVVHELSFSYDFRKVRRATQDDPVYVRIDYASMPTWWQKVVDEAPSRKRFWSKSDETWKTKIEQIRQSTDFDENQLLGITNPFFSEVIYKQTSNTCAAPGSKRSFSDDGFLAVSLEGSATASLRWGYTMVGTISPELNLEEAHGFFDTALSSRGQLFVDGSGTLDIQGTLPTAELFGKGGVTDFGWSQPGIVSFKPTLTMGVEMTGSGNLDANFTLKYYTSPGAMVQTNSVNMGDFSGFLDRTSTRQDYSGSVTASPISGAGNSEVVFGIRIMPQTEMDITLFDYSSNDKRDLDSRDVVQASAQFAARLMQTIQVTSDGSKVQVINGYDPIHVWVDSDNITPAWTANGEATVAIPPGVSPAVMYTGGGEDPGPRNPPNLDGDAAFSGHYMQCSGSGGSSSLTCYSLANVSSIDTDLRDDFNGENEAANAEDRLLEKTGSLTTREVPFLEVARLIDRKATPTWELAPRSTGTSRPWTITGPPGTTPFTTRSSEYLTGDSGRILIGANPSAGYLNLLNEYDCLGAVITDSAGPSRDLAAEHILEQNLVALGWQFLTTGTVPAASQALGYATVYQAEVIPWSLMGGNGVFRQTWDTWDPNAPAGTHDHPDLSPEREMWDAIGSITHPEYMVNLQQTLNAFKSRIMRGISGISLDRWVEFNFDDTSEATGFGNAIGALSEIRLFLGVINYLNHPTVHAPFMASLNRINAILEQFDAAVARNVLNGGTPTHAGLLWREFIYQIVIGRTEASQGQYRQWLQRIQSNWQDAFRTATANGASPNRLTEINTILTDVSDLLAKYRYDPIKPDLYQINTAGLFPAPF